MPAATAAGSSPLRAEHRRSALVFLSLAALAAATFAGGPRAALGLVYERSAVLGGQWWRLLTGHLVHASPAHLGWDLAAALLIGLAVGPALRAGPWIAVALVVAVVSSAGVLVLQPRVHAMAGLSGLLHGLLAAGAVAQVRQGERVGWVFLALLAAKIAWEQLAGPSPVVAETLGGPIAVGAHALGAAAGLLAGFVAPVPTSSTSAARP